MTVYLNGRFLPLAEARISPLDRGFLFGDGVYEVIPVYSRRPFRLDEHLSRLQTSLDGIHLPNPLSLEGWRTMIGQLVASADFVDQSVLLQVTRGADDKRDHAFPQGVAPTVFAFTAPLVTPSDATRAAGIAAITAPDTRWQRCDLKTISLLANVLARQQAVDAGAVETLLLRDGLLTEGAASSIFVVSEGVLLAPPKDHRVLPGITYDLVLELAARHGVSYAVRDISERELRAADELWMTSSTKEILPIVRLDGLPVGHGRPGPLAQQMYAWYRAFRDDVMRNADV
ncbi:D-amino acid aminotransferase [Rhodocyclus tenuis]|uniref:D-amino acid aminotransferase n=1 Tax=Rhodocyclus gracilis TaxID=2929842 RepID=A0ABX0WF97_9RHOO|nr:D-amino acid aminotransferase [Rhodocyclus gracilis]MRD73583.1 D-amino acid aminotransferase [Rhodocyclus gracilis]NJA88307.1 D-amino acid aminotransferase [Rhodocyclus gracilis]